jgi:hypothetical protein
MSKSLNTNRRAVVQVPFFPGFYESSLSGIVDYEEESRNENEMEKIQAIEEGSSYYKPDDLEYGPDYVKTRKLIPDFTIDSNDVWQAYFDSTDYSACYRSIAKAYAESLVDFMENELGFKSKACFESMDSPREYNFSTDRLYLFFPWKELQAMRRELPKEKLQEAIADRFTSCDGFISFYKNELEEWPRSLRDWDYNQLGTLFGAWIEWRAGKQQRFEWDSQSVENWICDSIEDSIRDSAYEHLDAGVDYEKAHGKLRELMADAVAESEEENPNAEPLPERCPETLELFPTSEEKGV